MALITCKECSAQVSSTALSCPQCGAKLRNPKRGVFGVTSKWLFIGFNLFMLYATMKGLGDASQTVKSGASEAERAGAAVGTGLGAMILLIIWGAGAVILGSITYFTRAKR
jgi:hypothetical protein